MQCLALNRGQRLLAFIFIIFSMLVYWKGVYIYLFKIFTSFIHILTLVSSRTYQACFGVLTKVACVGHTPQSALPPSLSPRALRLLWWPICAQITSLRYRFWKGVTTHTCRYPQVRRRDPSREILLPCGPPLVHRTWR